MALEWLGPAVSFVSGLLGFGSSKNTNDVNLQIARETNQANAELAKYNWQQQKMMWHNNNVYNSPSSQMSRYRDAGLNPNLIYGQGSNGNSTSIPTPATPTMQAAHVDRIPYESLFGSLGDDIMAAYNFRLQREKLEAETKLVESQSAAQLAQVNKSNAEIAKIGQDTARTEQQYRQSEQLFDYTKKAADLQVKQGVANLEDTYNRIEQRPIERLKLEAEVELLRSSKVKNYADAKKVSQEILESSARIAKLAVETDFTREQIVNLRRQGYGYLLDNSFKQATFDERVKMISEDLLGRYNQNNWNSAFGYSKDALSGVFGSAIWGVAQSFGGVRR